MATDKNEFLQKLQAEIEAELSTAEADGPDDGYALPPSGWLFDPTDIEREQVGLRNLLAATEALERDGKPGPLTLT